MRALFTRPALLISVLLATNTRPVAAQNNTPQALPAIGTSGGTPFSRACPAGRYHRRSRAHGPRHRCARHQVPRGRRKRFARRRKRLRVARGRQWRNVQLRLVPSKHGRHGPRWVANGTGGGWFVVPAMPQVGCRDATVDRRSGHDDSPDRWCGRRALDHRLALPVAYSRRHELCASDAASNHPARTVGSHHRRSGAHLQ